MTAPSANDLLTGARPAGTDDGHRGGRAAPAAQNSDLALMRIMWERLGWDPPFGHITAIDRNVEARYESQQRNPKVVPPGRDKQLIYYSPTKTAQMPEGERWALNDWKLARVAEGVALDHGIQDRIIACQGDDKAMKRLVAQAMTRAKADQGADQGTARHKIAEKIDFGIEPGPLSDRMRVDIEAYRAVTRGLDMVLAEVFVVYDLDKMGGTLDRVAYYPATGCYHILDLKPPDSGYGQGERSIQFGIYSHSQPYNWNLAQHLLATDRKALKTTNLRTELPQPLDMERAIMVHVPRGGIGRAFTAWVDIDQGWREGFDIARRMRRWQNRDFQESLVTPFEVKPPPTVLDTGRRPERSDESVARVAALAGGATPYRKASPDGRPMTTVDLPPVPPEQDAVAMAAAVQAVARAGGVTSADDLDRTDPAHPAAKITAALRAATTVAEVRAAWRANVKSPYWDTTHKVLAETLAAKYKAQEAQDEARQAAQNGGPPS